MVTIEHQVIRQNGVVLLSVLVPEGKPYKWDEAIHEIRGEIFTRSRALPGGEWITWARYPDGFGSSPELPQLLRFPVVAGDLFR